MAVAGGAPDDLGMSDLLLVFLVVFLPTFLAALFAYLWRRSAREATAAEQDASAVRARFSSVIDADAEEKRVRAETARASTELEELRRSYREKKQVYDQMVGQIAIFDEKMAFAELGVYEPHFEFSDSEAYRTAILEVRERQKAMVSAKTAVVANTAWTVDGSAAKGQTMNNRNVRLTSRAFNNECEAAVANVRWNNVVAMEKRILRAKEQIDNLNASNGVVISDAYVDLKLAELRLTHEHREKQKAEREERAEAARLAREEQKLQRDLERAEEEEARYARLLERAQKEASTAIGPELEAYRAQVAVLERDLAEAHARTERAQALAEQTRSGYVYVISNIGSFGEGVVKIGLTRRLDPIDRVRELGDASVPFAFDMHAMIYSDDAPSLERALHGAFEATRINVTNARKEFFRATIDEVEHAVRRLAPEAPFIKDVEAQEFRETQARRLAALNASASSAREAFPAAI
ncbi:MAG: DUF4041 domain-containing protein [Hyphomonas sp.]|nr:DUF4041 domain-containing protein [Hyphomonas sp.]